MLAWGWRIERTREGDSMALYNRTRRISQTSQVSNFVENLPPQKLIKSHTKFAFHSLFFTSDEIVQ